MPAYVRRLEIDWSWPQLTEAERAVVRRHEARVEADPRTHSLTTFKEAMAAASRELPSREIRCRVTDEYGVYLFAVRAGRCVSSEAFDEGGKLSEPLTTDDYRAAGVQELSVVLFWPEAMIQSLNELASRLDYSLSRLVQKAWLVGNGALSETTNDELPRDGAPRKQSIYLPIEIYEELRDTATRENRSMSFIVQRALGNAWPVISKVPAPT